MESAPSAAWWQLAHLYCPRIFYSLLRWCSFGPGNWASFAFSRYRPQTGEKNSAAFLKAGGGLAACCPAAGEKSQNQQNQSGPDADIVPVGR